MSDGEHHAHVDSLSSQHAARIASSAFSAAKVEHSFGQVEPLASTRARPNTTSIFTLHGAILRRRQPVQSMAV